MIVISSKGNFQNTEKFLKRMSKGEIFRSLQKYGQEGVSALSSVTPTESGRTASSWDYEVRIRHGSASIVWKNTNTVKGTNIAIILQYGHGTGTGGYVQGRDYINPAIKPVMDRIANDVWKELTK
mgnify:CR=1 FL=1